LVTHGDITLEKTCVKLDNLLSQLWAVQPREEVLPRIQTNGCHPQDDEGIQSLEHCSPMQVVPDGFVKRTNQPI